MLSRLIRLCRRLQSRAIATQLRWRIADHEAMACCIEADMLAGPVRLARARAAITDLQIRLEAVEGNR